MIRRPPRSTPLSLHDALPISHPQRERRGRPPLPHRPGLLERQPGGGHRHPPEAVAARSEEHTSELQSPCNLVCRLLLEKKKKRKTHTLTRMTRQRPAVYASQT